MFIGGIIIVVLLILDQVVKQVSLVLSSGNEQLIKVIIKDVLEFHYLINDGASFGMLEGRQLLFSLITVGALVLFGYLFLESNFKTKKVYSISIALFIAGTLGNAIDRTLRGGGVIDMFNMPILNEILSYVKISPFIFNLADAYLTFAIILFAIDIFFLESKRKGLNE